VTETGAVDLEVGTVVRDGVLCFVNIGDQLTPELGGRIIETAQDICSKKFNGEFTWYQ
jgi:hypothetical protein